MNDRDIQQLMAELISFEPSLKGRESEMRTLIQSMIAAKPNARFDERAKKQLRAQLLQKSAEPQAAILGWMQWSIGFGAIAAVAIMGVIVFQPDTPQSQNKSALVISDVAPEAFGNLSKSTVSAQPIRSGGGVEDTSVTIAPASYGYRYAYTGDLDLPSMVDVLERKPTSLQLSDLTSTDFGIINLGQRQADIQSLSLSYQGYQVDLQLQYGSLSISVANNGVVRTDAALGENALATDGEILNAVRNFVNTFGLRLSFYGTPEVRRPNYSDVIGIEGTLPSKELYVGDVTVFYPLLINGQSVASLYGDSVGAMFNVNPQTLQVTSAYNITLQQYQRSAYPAETDEQTIRDILEQGGPYGYATLDSTVLQLGTPTTVLANVSLETDGFYHDVYVPALQFPVIDAPEGTPKFVLVPLLKAFLDQSSTPRGIEIPIIDLPADGQGTSSGAAGIEPTTLEDPVVAE